MKLVYIIGPGAVGKMTVGQELEKLTGLKLFHNHMTIDLVLNFFEFNSKEGGYLIHLFREELFKTMAGSDQPGMIFTYMWAFDMQSDWDYIAHVTSMFKAVGADIYYVELKADHEVRLARNKTPNRLANKPSKRDVAASEQRFIREETNFRLNSNPGEMPFENYMCIDNTHLKPDVVAQQIVDAFGWRFDASCHHPRSRATDVNERDWLKD